MKVLERGQISLWHYLNEVVWRFMNIQSLAIASGCAEGAQMARNRIPGNKVMLFLEGRMRRNPIRKLHRSIEVGDGPNRKRRSWR